MSFKMKFKKKCKKKLFNNLKIKSCLQINQTKNEFKTLKTLMGSD